MPREYGTDPYGIIARGAPSSRGGGLSDVGVSIGRVGIPMSTIFPGVSAGTGVGGRLSIPIASMPAVKKRAKGGLAAKPIWEKDRPDDLGKPKSLSVKRKAAAKRRAKAAGRPYPNLVDNVFAARKKGK